MTAPSTPAADRHTRAWLWAGVAQYAFFGLALLGASGAAAPLARGVAGGAGGLDLLAAATGAGLFLDTLVGLGGVLFPAALIEPLRAALWQGSTGWLAAGAGLASCTVAWVLTANLLPGSEGRPQAAGPSLAVGAPLYPRLAKYRDFHWGTLTAYAVGIFGAELVLAGLYTWLVSLVPTRHRGSALLGAASQQLVDQASQGLFDFKGFSPPAAFSLALLVAFVVTFCCGFLGAANSRRLSIPEATIAVIYFGVPVPLVLSLQHHVPELMLRIGYSVREITYLSSLLGQNRPELGYWLVFCGLVLVLFLGITSGFVATSSGRPDLRMGFELFVSSRHVSVFRPGLLLGVLAVLSLGILPPLLIWGLLSAAEAAVERTRIRKLGMIDPLAASAALNRLRLRQQTPTAMMTALSVGGVSVGVMALIIVLSVMSGFEDDLQKKILGTNAHAVILKYSDSMSDYQKVMDTARQVDGVVGLTPFILNEVMISSEGNISGVMIKGIDPKTVGSVTDLPSYLLGGRSIDILERPEELVPKRLSPEGGAVIDDQPPAGGGSPDIERAPRGELADDPLIEPQRGGSGSDVVLPGIIIGRELAAALKVVAGDRVNIVSPLGGELGPQGPMPKSRPFRVAAIFYSGMYEYDSKFVYIRLDEAQAFFKVTGASGVEVRVDDIDDARRLSKEIYDRLEGYPYRTKDWGEMNRNLFSALRLEKLVMAIILSIIVIVAAGLIVATVIMLVLEKRKEIAVLKALGVPDGGIVKIFLAEGLQIGIAGGLLGLLGGLGWCLLIEKVGIKLDPEVYYIPALPVRVEPFQTGLAVVIAILVTFLASIYPALKASQVEPVEGLKAE